ncbi:fatty acid synthase [Helicoverpa armigera]|uniref:fatty acid synthase n=1 Tax=Helicoverpa armigera TaxID=29058 RepID=UPI003082B4B5
MAPNPKTVITDREPRDDFERPLTGDEIVISGVSGAFPKCENTVELMENLYNKVDMVEEVDCSTVKHPGLPKYFGKMKNQHKFDAQFFRVTPWQAASLDPLSRKVMENAFCAIYDSGINPLTLSGTKLGVFIGSSFSDTVAMNLYETLQRNAFVISGCSKTMLANRISYWIDGKGPSYGLDQACSSAMACLEIAYDSMKRGDCDAALVGGCNTCVHPLLSLNLQIAGLACRDGKTKSFDKNGDGFVRSEAVNLIFLQKAKDAKRIYAEIHHIKGKYFTRPDANFLPIRKSEDLEQFLEEFYAEVKVSPSDVEYIEAYGSGIAEADGNELDAVGKFFAKSRSIKVGSVKSNMGNTEAASGVCSLTKLCLAYHKGEIPANLHYNEPQDHIPAVRDGRVQVVTENTPFGRGYAAVNNFSFTGCNFHVLLKGHHKNKDSSRYKSSIPRLILLSAREKIGVDKAIDELMSKPIDPEQIALLHNIYKINFPGHTGRGYAVLDTNENNETVNLASSFEIYSGTTRPVCFLYSGMGSQWNGMGRELLRIPLFAAAIEKCQRVLEPHGIDLVKIITDPDKTIFDNILNSMVGITAIQIGLTDILRAMGITPDVIVGHSIGELGCAYADGCFTAEETIISSYNRGIVSIQTPFIKGSMAAIGLSYNDILPMCPPGIEVACHNSAESATISGPADIMKEFVTDLTNRGIFAREVACSNIAYHSSYIAEAGPALLSSMETLIPNPKLRTEKWISTSVPQDKWDDDEAKYSSSAYFTNNLLNPVLFEENAKLVPKDAIMIEIAPHGLLQAIVKKSHSECVNVALTKRANPDPVTFLLQAVGKLYENGLNPAIDILYPKVEFPVSTETPLLSHLVEWEHSVDWPELVVVNKTVKETSARNFVISAYDDEHKYLKGYVRNGINEVPETALFVFLWETLAMYRGSYYKDMPVTFYDVTFHCQLKLDPEDMLRLRVTVQEGSNRFEIYTGKTNIVSGFVKNVAEKVRKYADDNESANDIVISGEDFYTLLRMRGYSYGDDFKTIQSLNTTRNTANIKWTGEWATFLDSLIQLNAFVRGHNGVSTPKIIKRLSVHVKGHAMTETTVIDGATYYKAELAELNQLVRCGGVELDGVIYNDKPRVEKQPDVLVAREFITHEFEETTSIQTATSINLQVVADNVSSNKIKVLELMTSSTESLSNVIKDAAVKLTSHQFDVNSIEVANVEVQDIVDVELFVVHNLLRNEQISSALKQVIKPNAFILTFERNTSEVETKDFNVITSLPVNGGVLSLLKKKDNADNENVIYIPIELDSTFSWLQRVQSELRKTRQVVLISERQPYCGLLGYVKKLKSQGHNIGVVIVDDYHAPSFNPEKPIYKEQLQKKLAFNILKKGQWGSYYYVVPSTDKVKLQNLSLTSPATKGDFNDFTWEETPIGNGNLVEVKYAGISARDCLKALGDTIDQKKSFGMDFSGIDSKGDQVMGLVASGALSSSVVADPTLLWPVPKHWTLEEAASVPLPYLHAYYILVIKGKIKRNQRVFVTGGAGALGQAVISICLDFDCTVFTTVSDEKKKRFLMKLFPKLKDENISYSRHDTFFTRVAATKDQRCNIVVNCSNGPLRQASMKCVGFLGKFIDVSHVDISANTDFGMSYLAEEKHYIFANFSTIFEPKNVQDRKVLQLLMSEGIANGTVRPLSRVVYSPLEVSRAFKLVSSSKHRGRALIKMSDLKSLSSNFNVVPRVLFNKGVHIVICDNSNLAVEVIDNLIQKGAKKLVLHLRKQYQTNYLYAKAASWKPFDVHIELNMENLQTKEGCERLLKAGQKLESVASIFIVQDYKEKVNDDINANVDFKSSYEDMIAVTANLDMVSRNICSDLRDFVVVSVASENIGSEHATSACEKICEARTKVGLPALVLRFDTSNAANQSEKTLLSKLDGLSLSSLFNALERSIKLKHNNVLAINLTTKSSYDLVEKMAVMFGVQNIDEIDEDLTLKETNVNDMMIDEIKARFTPVTYYTDDLLDMTVACLKKLYLKLGEKKNINFDAGLKAFYSHIENNEYVAVDAIVPMKTQLISFEEHGYIDRTQNHLMLIPGFDGRHQVLETVAERLKIRAATLQLGADVIYDSIPEIAQHLSKHIKAHLEVRSKFYILGYSFGVNVALEVAKLLEDEGHIGVVYCLESSPDALKSQLKAYLGDQTEVELQNNVLLHMYQLMTEQKGDEFKQELEKLDNWPDKLQLSMKRLRGLVHFSSEHIRTLLESSYRRIVLALDYKPKFQLKSEIVLIKGIPHPKVERLSDDYDLSKYTKQPVKVFHIESDLAAAPYDSRVSNIVNKTLDPTFLEEFKRKNLCEYYHLK